MITQSLCCICLEVTKVHHVLFGVRVESHAWVYVWHVVHVLQFEIRKLEVRVG